ncbi:hypothetical protein FHT02_003250 [Sphingomonas xinjiangensis]|uniref:Uncharacterized protein n=1 Tax=Sphingomonas xinjiangensis TaxID=643568 RepID=A0A840YEW3_9SPHN|nr:hypothetical protein [Sphingomonas xinjiangensis]
MTARLDSLHRPVAAFGALFFSVALVVFSTPVIPIA